MFSGDKSENKEYEDIYGKYLKLSIIKHSNSTEVTIKKIKNYNLRSKCLILFLIIFVGFFGVLFELYSIKYFVFLVLIIILVTWKIFHVVKSEKLLYVPQLGCQITQKYKFGFSSAFIPAKSIQGLFINEVFSKHRVLFVLSILVKDENKDTIIPLFTGTKPRLKCLEIIYQHLLD
ncbi:phosphatidylinositol N-acetylglucosaminyltransferase subunit H-like [Onthophagus taurus]|uniref:phosphatidylinositol N-acetylglucosaminyltransferase subunit H-like n=1 Tax=Onthophagus taurus TaxID=166361 RepID=UPI0039BDFA8F